MQNNSINVCLIQLAVVPYNFQVNKNKIEKYIEKVMNLNKCKPDVIVLPEMWNIGYTINKVEEYADKNGEKTKHFLTELAKKYKVIIIGGSIASYNTYKKIYENLNMNIDMEGNLLYTYSKVHLFSPSKENSVFTRGSQFNVITTTINKNSIKNSTSDSNETNNTSDSSETNNFSDSNEINNTNSKLECTFSTVICYDIRFPEFIRSIALKGINLKNQKNNNLNKQSKQQPQQPQQISSSTVTTTTTITTSTTTKTTTTNTKKNSNTNTKTVNDSTSNTKSLEGGLDILFVSAAWPYPRLHHWKSLLIARAIENQCFVVAVNNCGEMDGLTFCGHSLIVDPWGEILIEGEGPKDPLLLESLTDDDNDNNSNSIKYKEKIENENQLVNGQKAFDEILISSLSFDILKDIRQRICIFNDRFPEVYRCN